MQNLYPTVSEEILVQIKTYNLKMFFEIIIDQLLRLYMKSC